MREYNELEEEWTNFYDFYNDETGLEATLNVNGYNAPW